MTQTITPEQGKSIDSAKSFLLGLASRDPSEAPLLARFVQTSIANGSYEFNVAVTDYLISCTQGMPPIFEHWNPLGTLQNHRTLD